MGFYGTEPVFGLMQWEIMESALQIGFIPRELLKHASEPP